VTPVGGVPDFTPRLQFLPQTFSRPAAPPEGVPRAVSRNLPSFGDRLVVVGRRFLALVTGRVLGSFTFFWSAWRSAGRQCTVCSSSKLSF